MCISLHLLIKSKKKKIFFFLHVIILSPILKNKEKNSETRASLTLDKVLKQNISLVQKEEEEKKKKSLNTYKLRVQHCVVGLDSREKNSHPTHSSPPPPPPPPPLPTSAILATSFHQNSHSHRTRSQWRQLQPSSPSFGYC